MPGKKILLDTPTTNPALGYQRIASAFREIITESRPNFAIGVFGDWGSGKTTLMAAIKAKLPKDSVLAVDFNAWRFEREPQLLIPLLDTIRSALLNHAEGRPATASKVRVIAQRLGKVVRALAAGVSGSVGLPGAVTVNYDAAPVLEAFSDLASEKDPLAPKSLYVAAFQELQSSFSELADTGISRIVVFVDDLDRCLPGNALDVLESVKLFFDLPGFIFVVGLDEDVIDRALLAKFGAESGPATAAKNDQSPTTLESLGEQLGQVYAKKIFQVPYALPVMLPQQLDELLHSMYREAELGPEQLDELQHRVRPYLRLVAVHRRVNPREVKRFINGYTLQTLVRPDLDPEAILAMQVIAFRYDWREAYDAMNADPGLFLAALRRFRHGNQDAFDDALPGLERFPAELSVYLASPLAGPLAALESLDPYLSSLRSTHGIDPWFSDVLSFLGRLDRAISAALATGSAATILDVSEQGQGIKEFIRSLDKHSTRGAMERMRRISSMVDELTRSRQSTEGQIPLEGLEGLPIDARTSVAVLRNLQREVERLRADLRFARDSDAR